MVIVIGFPHHNTLGIVRSVGLMHAPVLLILRSKKRDCVSKSRFVSQVGFAETDEDLYELLKNRNVGNSGKDVILSCDDYTAIFLDTHYAEFKDKYRFFNCGEKGKISYYSDKVIQCELAKEVGLNVPATISCRPNELVDYELHLPCIIRPQKSVNGGKNLFVIKNNSDISQAITKFSSDNPIIIQEFLHKDSEIVVLGLSRPGEVIIPGYILKHREVKGATTFSTVCPIDDIVQLVNPIKKLMANMNYVGLFGMEFIKTADTYHFIEVNLRTDATLYSLVVAGANLPKMYVEDNIDKNLTVNRIDSIVEFADLPFVLKRQVRISDWIKNIKNSTCRYYYRRDDKKPYYAELWFFVKWVVCRVLRIKR